MRWLNSNSSNLPNDRVVVFTSQVGKPLQTSHPGPRLPTVQRSSVVSNLRYTGHQINAFITAAGPCGATNSSRLIPWRPQAIPHSLACRSSTTRRRGPCCSRLSEAMRRPPTRMVGRSCRRDDHAGAEYDALRTPAGQTGTAATGPDRLWPARYSKSPAERRNRSVRLPSGELTNRCLSCFRTTSSRQRQRLSLAGKTFRPLPGDKFPRQSSSTEGRRHPEAEALAHLVRPAVCTQIRDRAHVGPL
jgi:hypothetical protein